MSIRANMLIGHQLGRAEIFATGAEQLFKHLRTPDSHFAQRLTAAERLIASTSFTLDGLTRGFEGLSSGASLRYRLSNFGELRDTRAAAREILDGINQLSYTPAAVAESAPDLLAKTTALTERIKAMPGFDRTFPVSTAGSIEAYRASTLESVAGAIGMV